MLTECRSATKTVGDSSGAQCWQRALESPTGKAEPALLSALSPQCFEPLARRALKEQLLPKGNGC